MDGQRAGLRSFVVPHVDVVFPGRPFRGVARHRVGRASAHVVVFVLGVSSYSILSFSAWFVCTRTSYAVPVVVEGWRLKMYPAATPLEQDPRWRFVAHQLIEVYDSTYYVYRGYILSLGGHSKECVVTAGIRSTSGCITCSPGQCVEPASRRTTLL